MTVDGDQSVTGGEERFELERFEWTAPDRLRVEGAFVGLPEGAGGPPVLVLRGDGGAHRLPPTPDSVAGRLHEGGQWHGEFVWQQPPAPFDSAELLLGDELVVRLPAPGSKRMRFRRRTLDVTHPGATPAPHADAAAVDAPGGTWSGADPVVAQAAAPIRLEADLVAAQEEAHQLRAAVARAEEELVRLRAELVAERDARAGDADRFQQGLARLRASAEQALAAGELEAGRSGDELRKAHQDDLKQQQDQQAGLRAELDAALAARDEVRAAAKGELDAALVTRDEVQAAARAELDAALAAHKTAEADRCVELDALRARLTAIEALGGEAREARAEAQQLLERLTTIAGQFDAAR